MEEMRAARRKYWTPEEDKKLIEYVKTHGRGNWNKVAQSLDIGKSRSSCLQRYNNHLAPGLLHTDFTEEEIYKMETLLALHHKKWAFIARQLPGRTANDVKNWYHKQLAKNARDREGPSVGDAPPQHPAGGPTVGGDGFGGFNHQFVNGADDFGGYNNGAGDGFGGFNQPFVNGGDGFGGYDQPLVDFRGYNQQFVNSGGFNQEFVESADDGFAVVDDVIHDIHQYLNYSSTPGPDDLLIYNGDGLWDFNDQKFLNNGGGGGGGGGAGA